MRVLLSVRGERTAGPFYLPSLLIIASFFVSRGRQMGKGIRQLKAIIPRTLKKVNDDLMIFLYSDISEWEIGELAFWRGQMKPFLADLFSYDYEFRHGV